MPTSRGDFVWYELMTSDPAGATAFYTGLLGWHASDAGMPGMAYTLLHAGERSVAGLMQLPPDARAAGAPVAWLGYVAVDDVDAAAARVVAAGGRMHHGPEDIPQVGRFASVADPQGASFVLFKGTGEPMPPAPPGSPGLVGWHELGTSDQAAALDFYRGLLGWGLGVSMDMGPLGTYQVFTDAAGTPIGGVMNNAEPGTHPHWLYYFQVASIDAAVGLVRARGGSMLTEPHQVPDGPWICACRDPQGGRFALMSAAR